MGYRYQNKLDEENERLYWSQFPRWRRVLNRLTVFIFTVLFFALAFYSGIGWIILHFI